VLSLLVLLLAGGALLRALRRAARRAAFDAPVVFEEPAR
jgi:energy-coupling factor transport system substrate-specific component